MRVKRFEDLIVWQKSRDLSVAIYRVTSQGAFVRDYGLRDQIRRAAVSVMSNIAEGFGRYSRSEMRQFLSIARGSVAEVRSQLYLARELGYVQEHDHDSLHALCIEIGRMLAGLRASIDTPKHH
jgi:four helix bundle protein